MTLAAALAEYGRLIDRPPHVETVGELIDEYIKMQLPLLKPRTQKNRLIELRNLRAVFGEMAILEVEPVDVVGYKMRRREAPIRCNRELAALSAVFSFALNWCGIPIRSNPCSEVQHFPENRGKRDRCPEPVELQAFATLCREHFKDNQTPLYLELKRAVGLRLGDMLRLQWSAIGAEGLRVDSGKSGKKQLFRFADPANGESTGLAELLEQTRQLPRPINSLWIFCTRRGQPYTVEGFQPNWQRRMSAYVKAGGVRFWEHDVRATAGTEAEEARGIEEARKLLGHSEQSTTRIYTGRRKVVSVLPNRGR